MNFEGKTVLVTGGSRGIGKVIAFNFAELGAKVIITYLSRKEDADDLVAEIKSSGGQALAVECDVSKTDDVKNLHEIAKKNFGSVDILINNAGITKDNLLIMLEEEDWDTVLDTNLKGTYLCTKYFVKDMLKKRSGKIVNITSIAGSMGNDGQSNYSAAKAGMIGFTKSVAKEVANRGVNVNAVAPGFIETEMTDALPENIKEHYLKRILLKRIGKPQDIADVVTFLCSEKSSYITGEVINVDGGLVI